MKKNKSFSTDALIYEIQINSSIISDFLIYVKISKFMCKKIFNFSNQKFYENVF